MKVGVHPGVQVFEFFLRYWPPLIATLNTIGFLYILFDLDPTGFIISNILTSFGRPVTTKRSLIVLTCSFLLRVFHTLSVSYLGLVVIMGTVMITLFLSYIISDAFFQLNNWVSLHLKVIKIKTDVNDKVLSVCKIPTRLKLVNIHSELQLFDTLANKVGFLMVPFLLLCAFGCIVSVNYATIRMHSVIPMPYFLLMPLAGGSLSLGLFIFLPAISGVNESSQQFLKQMSVLCCNNKCLLRRVKALRAFRFTIGPICMFKRSTITTIWTCLIEYTINAILLYPDI